MRYLATGAPAKRSPVPVPDPGHDKDSGQRGQRTYGKFIRERFGPDGPRGGERHNAHTA